MGHLFLVILTLMFGCVNSNDPIDTGDGKFDTADGLYGLQISNLVFTDINNVKATVKFSDNEHQNDDEYALRIFAVTIDDDYNEEVIYSDRIDLNNSNVKFKVSLLDFMGKMSGSDRGIDAKFFRFEITKRCGSNSCGEIVSYRYIGGIIRPFPDSELSLGGTYTPKPSDKDTIIDFWNEAYLSCNNVMFIVPPTKYESSFTDHGLEGIIEKRNYDCFISVVYHAKDVEVSSRSRNTIQYCNSTTFGTDAYQELLSLNEVGAASLPFRFDAFGYSKGAGILATLWHRLQEAGTTQQYLPESTRLYAIGLPTKLGLEHLPLYQPGNIERFGNLVVFNWKNDPVAKVNDCGDVLGIAWFGANASKHNYLPFLKTKLINGSADPITHAEFRDSFIEGRKQYVGDIYQD